MRSLNKLVREKNVCSLPWLHAEISLPTNSIKPCCKFEGNFNDPKKEFTVIWADKNFDHLRSDMINEKNIAECSACHVSDDVFSYKKWKNNSYRNMMLMDYEPLPLPKVFHFTLKNTCNLACRMCSPGVSSKLDQVARKSVILQKYLAVTEPNNSFNIERFRGSFANAEHITFAGGEPTIDDDCLSLIKIIKQESSKLKSVNFSTNMTRLNHDLLKELSEMNCTVMLSISIDGPPAVHEYIRYKCKWDDIVGNLDYITEHYPKIKLAINTTVSVLNVGYVIQSLELFHDLEKRLKTNFHHLMISPVLDKPFLHPGILSDDTKKMYLKQLTDYQGTCTIPDSKNLIPTAINMLNETTTSTISEFDEYMSEFDRIAGTNYKLLYPEFGAPTW